jgi:nucleotide-binding universal stress UspA family protein
MAREVLGWTSGVMAMGGPGVVAGFDGSASSVRALEWATVEAALRRTRLTVCLAWQDAETTSSAEDGRVFAAARRTLARGVVLASRQSAGLDVVPRLLAGPAAAGLLQESAGADLLVAGTRGTGNWSWPGVGSVSNQLAASASSPLLLVTDDGLWHDGPVVVGVDGSASSERAAGFAFEEAHLRHAPVVAVCWSPEPGQAERVTGMWRGKYPDVAFSASAEPRAPATALLALADTAPLLVIGAHGTGDLPGLLLGTVAHELVHNVAHPIAVVR